jgi:hypothetical protein
VNTPPLPSSLDAIAADPANAAGLSPESITKLLAQLAAVQAAITARLVAATISGNSNGAHEIIEADEFLTPAEAAKLLRRSTRWIWRRKRTLPFVRCAGNRSLLCSRRGITAWIAAQKVR